MEIVTWNIQCGRGVDGIVDLQRIARTAQAMGDLDVVCLQEVAQHMPDVDGGAGADQVAELAAAFPGYTSVFGAAVDILGADERRKRFGNLILSRLPIQQIFRHLLPQPADPSAKKSMPRQATEVVVAGETGALRIVTIHLEYYSERQRGAQADRLRVLHEEICANERQPPRQAGDGPYAPTPRPAAAVFCGDFNFIPNDRIYTQLLAPIGEQAPRLCDAWEVAHPGRAHDPTCGVFDREQWPQGPHCRDFFFVTEDLADRVSGVEVDTETPASDHQPVRLVV